MRITKMSANIREVIVIYQVTLRKSSFLNCSTVVRAKKDFSGAIVQGLCDETTIAIARTLLCASMSALVA